MFEAGSAEYRRITFCMALGSFIIFSNLYVFQPILPVLAVQFDLAATEVNWVFASTTCLLALSLVFWAMVSDWLGRKNTLLLGIAGAVLVNIVLLLWPSFSMLIASRALMGIALAAFAGVAMGYLGDVLTPRALAKAVGGYIAANSLGGIAGRLCGGILTDYFSWQIALVWLSAVTLLCGIFLWFTLPQEQQAKKPPVPIGTMVGYVKQHLSDKPVALMMLIGGLNFALLVNLFTVTGFRLSAAPFELPTSITAMIFLCYLTGTLTAKISSRWAARDSHLDGVLVGTLVTLAGILTTYVAREIFILLGLLLISAGAFFVHALAYSWVGLKAKQHKASAGALYLVHYYVGGSAGGFYLLWCWESAGWSAVIVASIVLILAILLTRSYLQRVA